MATSNNLGFPFLATNQTQKEVTANQALTVIDAIMNNAVIDRDLATPPVSPSEGDLYIPAATATGDWTGKEDDIAFFADGIWQFITPAEGLTLFVADEDVLITYDGSAWGAPNFNNMAILGVNTTANTTNKLAVRSNAVLFTALNVADSGTGDMQFKVNKEAAADTASFLFQQNFSSYAEFGLIGDNDFTLKVSPDNFSTSFTAFTVDKDSGSVNFANGFTSSSLAYKSYPFAAAGLGLGTTYLGGYYEAPAADSNLTQASPTQTLGTANTAYGAHAFIVAGGAGSASGGSGTVEIEVSGTSITDAGVRTTSDTEIVIADITTLSTDQYLETNKKWIGQITYTLQNSGGSTHTTFSCDFNYGFSKYEDFGNRDFTLQEMEAVGVAGANDSGFDIIAYKHSSVGWTYDATSFVAGGTILGQWSTVFSTESQLANGQPFAGKLTGINESINGTGSEGIVFAIILGANNSVDYMSLHVGVNI